MLFFFFYYFVDSEKKQPVFFLFSLSFLFTTGAQKLCGTFNSTRNKIKSLISNDQEKSYGIKGFLLEMVKSLTFQVWLLIKKKNFDVKILFFIWYNDFLKIVSF